ncbi:RagB/SusD family nutrient uptake outer membrane protein [Alistipes onderdonkii]|uniref:RagB/SusD family nutrient uptake outer membrane protein n=1 Tax=Alistipes onderdonkii TaxID=328813 RepID=UPI00210CC1E4|nr:RagB/SusD family nutrient uptake outer membrane protein [Alistipes onderdonkii]MCQ4759388.1 RagB/SusD family nutrient uptake outer membrane protein [Alistipes onderdonkii]
MKLKHIIAVTVGAAALCAPSCDLDEKFYSEVTPDTFFTSPESTYAVLCRPFTHWKWYIGADRWYLQELTTDEMVCPKRGSDWYNSGEYYRLHYHTWSPDDRFVVNTYDGTTGGISRALEAKSDLQGVDYNAIGLNDAVKADHINQLNAITAYFYMRGLDYFGGMPIYYSVDDDLCARSTAHETYAHIETLLKDAIPALSKKTTLGASEDGYIKQAAAAALLAQLYFNAVAYIGEEHFDECAEICRDIIGGVYGTYELDKTWYGPHCFDNNTSPEVIWTVPSENSKVEWNWYFKYFYHYSSYEYFGIETAGYNGFMLTPSLDPQGRYYTQWKLGNPYQKFNDKDLRKKPYRYLGSRKYEGMFLVGDQTNPNNPSQQCLGQKEYSGKVINLVDQVARFSEVGTKYNSVAELTSTMADGEENSGVRLVKAPQPNLDDKLLRWNPDCPVIRLSEIYYMLAECELRAGDKKTAAGLINQVRGRNFEGGADPNPVTADNLDEYRMLDEWMIEFLGEGRRRTDLIRWDKFVTESWWDHTPLNDKNKNLFPIPNSAISANNLIEQNPGY